VPAATVKVTGVPGAADPPDQKGASGGRWGIARCRHRVDDALVARAVVARNGGADEQQCQNHDQPASRDLAVIRWEYGGEGCGGNSIEEGSR
jgi:hypothetical protein